jgi:PAS domain S-box-containing protein
MAEQSADIPDGYPTEKQLRDELERLRKRERFLRSILETQDEMLCRFLPDTTLTFVNEPYCRMFGRPAEELVGTRFLDLIPEDSHPGVMETISQLSASNRIITYSHEVRLPDGSIGWQQWTDTAIIDGDGNVTEIQSTGRDITRQKLVERELVLQTRLQELLMSISATYISIPETEVEESIHRSLAELGQFSGADRFYIFEYDFRRNTSNNTYEWCAPGIEPQIAYLQDYPNEHIPDWVETHLKGEIMHVPDVQALPQDSTIRQMLEPQDIKSLIAVPMMDRSDCIGFVGLDFVRQYHAITDYERKLLTIFAQMMVNVQNRIRTQKSLYESERFLSDLIDKSPSIIAVKNASGGYELVNQTWQYITGIPRKEALGRTDAELFDPETARNFMENDRYVLDTGETIDTEEVLGTGRDKRYFLSTKFPVRNMHGNITAVCGMIFEITDRKRAEEHRIARMGAEAASRAKTTFLSNMSHEIRTPLNAIIGFARVLERDMTLSEKQAEQIRTITRSSEHLLTLVNQTLDYSRIEAGAETVNPTRFRIRRLVDDALHMFRPKANRIGLRFQSNVTQEVPEFILADEAKIRQVLVNLLSNALKVTEKGSVMIQVGVRSPSDLPREESAASDAPSGQAHSSTGGVASRGSAASTRNDRITLFIEVEDTGPGIANDRIRHLFSKYFQLREGMRAGGTGLGLPISRKLAYLMEGNIEVESTPGKGSCFRLVLPVSVADRTDLQTETEQKRITRLSESAGKPKILVADDRRVNRELLRAILEPVGYLVREVQNGRQAVELFESWRPDAVLVDLRMPVVDGFRATQLIREKEMRDGGQRTRTPVIAVSSSVVHNRKSVRETRGLDGYISRPVDPGELLTLLGKLLGLTYLTGDQQTEYHTETARKLLTRESITALPPGIVREIRAATLEGDMIGLRKLADGLDPEHTAVSTGIRELASAYDYDTLLQLFDDTGNSNP